MAPIGLAAEEADWQWQNRVENGVAYRLGRKTVVFELPEALSAPNESASPSSPAPAPAASYPQIKIEHKAISLAGWTVTAVHGPIGNAQEMDSLASLLGVPPPEMVFPHNTLTLAHEATGTVYTLDAQSALCSVNGTATSEKGKGKCLNPRASDDVAASALKVSHAKEWGKSRSQGGASLDSNTRKYDWTYSCTWPGCVSSASSEEFATASDSRRDRIPVERLGADSEPILFFDEMVLFEDELGDNGTSILTIKVRVMPSCLLVLQRFFLRVDKVCFRIFDTRIFVPFASGPLSQTNSESSCRIIRDLQGVQTSYDAVRTKLPPYRPHDLSPLTDVNWVAQTMTKLPPPSQTQDSDVLPAWPGEGSVVETLQR